MPANGTVDVIIQTYTITPRRAERVSFAGALVVGLVYVEVWRNIPLLAWLVLFVFGLPFRQSLRHVILPQAGRRVVQPLANIAIALTMATALAGVVGVVDMTRAAQRINPELAQPLLVFSSVEVVSDLARVALSARRPVVDGLGGVRDGGAGDGGWVAARVATQPVHARLRRGHAHGSA